MLGRQSLAVGVVGVAGGGAGQGRPVSNAAVRAAVRALFP